MMRKSVVFMLSIEIKDFIDGLVVLQHGSELSGSDVQRAAERLQQRRIGQLTLEISLA